MKPRISRLTAHFPLLSLFGKERDWVDLYELVKNTWAPRDADLTGAMRIRADDVDARCLLSVFILGTMNLLPDDPNWAKAISPYMPNFPTKTDLGMKPREMVQTFGAGLDKVIFAPLFESGELLFC